MKAELPFNSIYRHGFARVAVAIPPVRVADPDYNVEQTLALAQQASKANAAVALFPELGLSAYSNEDLFHQDALLDAVRAGLTRLVDASVHLAPVLLVGAPLRFEGRLFNCAVAIYGGRILGVTPKTYLPNYREFYEKRQFTSARDAVVREVTLCGQTVPFGNDLIYEAANLPGLAIHTEICEDAWVPVPPSTYAALAGATVLANLSASNITIGKADYRRDLCAAQSGKCIAAYLYSAAGPGESTTDLAWDGHALIYENDEFLAESERFPTNAQMTLADVDLERLAQDRMRTTSFNDAAGEHRELLRGLRRIRFDFAVPQGEIPLERHVERFPYVPSDTAKRDERCFEAYNIQVHGLMKRLQSAGIERIVIGVSGGLDSTQALIVAARTMDRLGLPRENILAYTMPGFATSEVTLTNARGLMESLGVTAQELDIRPSCMQMLKDIGHPFVDGEPKYDVTFENVQAGERTSHLFRLANHHNAMVLGTGDLSELALGWTTYGVGDHMSHYNVNASVPKTLIQHLLRWVIQTGSSTATPASCCSPCWTPRFPRNSCPMTAATTANPLKAPSRRSVPTNCRISISTTLPATAFDPARWRSWPSPPGPTASTGRWPEGLTDDKRNQYDRATIKHWLDVFLFRFFKISQFKRSCVPNSPKVGSGGSLSPRGDWRAPSDSEATVWLQELRDNVPD